VRLLEKEKEQDLNETEIDNEDDIETIKQELSIEKEKAEKYFANWQRSQADFENYKRWSNQDKKEIIQFANSSLILELLPVIDDLAMAFNTLTEEIIDNNWVKGIKLIYNKLLTILKAQELSEIDALGQEFNPKIHVAVMCQEGPDGIVIEVTRKGYKLRDRVLRPSMVIVGKSKEEKEE
jgi:molecular chaperone GrpE